VPSDTIHCRRHKPLPLFFCTHSPPSLYFLSTETPWVLEVFTNRSLPP
jgi:hypothetical protein